MPSDEVVLQDIVNAVRLVLDFVKDSDKETYAYG
jgi:uncharacterized protein with HEPN domain